MLYSTEASRPNAPVNVLVGLEVLKSGFGWSDAQLEEQFSYNLQVCYALGYRDVAVGHLELRKVYNFRRRLLRVYSEHFAEEAAQIRLKTGEELRADGLQSPDDLEATYRKKRDGGHQGYVTNVTETCNPDNDVKLIVKVQTESNNTDDAVMLEEAVPDLVERTDVDEMYTDGGYNSADVDNMLNEQHIEQYQTAIRGGNSAGGAEANKMSLLLLEFVE